MVRNAIVNDISDHALREISPLKTLLSVLINDYSPVHLQFGMENI